MIGAPLATQSAKASPNETQTRTLAGVQDSLDAHFELTDQQRQLLDADARFQAFLREIALTVEPVLVSGLMIATTGNAGPAEVQGAMHEALRRHGDGSGAPPTIRVQLINPEAPEWHPGHHRGQSSSGSQGFQAGPRRGEGSVGSVGSIEGQSWTSAWPEQ